MIPPAPRQVALANPSFSRAHCLHQFARRSGGNFVFAQDAAIPWESVIDYGDVALVIDPKHGTYPTGTGHQLHPAWVNTLNRGRQHAIFTDRTVVGPDWLGTIAGGAPKLNTHASETQSQVRFKRVLVPGTTDRHCYLLRLAGDPANADAPANYIDKPNTAAGAQWRAELGSLNITTYAASQTLDTFLSDYPPRGTEIWFASAQMWGDSSAWPDGDDETWDSPNTGGDRCHVMQIHGDDAHSNQPSSMFLTVNGTEATNRIFWKTGRPATLGQTMATHVLQDGPTLTWEEIWSQTGVPMRAWNVWIWCMTFSTNPALARSSMWYLPNGTPYNAEPVPVVDTSDPAIGPTITNYANDYGMGQHTEHLTLVGQAPTNWGWLNPSGTRVNPLSPCGDNWTRPLAMYTYFNPGAGMNLRRSTIRGVPLRWHHRPAWRTRRQHAGDIWLGLLRSVGL